MFYNAILPGGISGDGYKIYIMEKLSNVSKISSLRLILANRASGLLLLVILTLLLTVFTDEIINTKYSIIAILFFASITIVSYSLLAKFVLKEAIDIQIKAGVYSFFVQAFSLGSAYLLLVGMNENLDNQQLVKYLILFMASCVAAILPISIGGAGIREVTFMYGASFLGLSQEMGVAFSIVYFSLNLLLSFVGIFFTTNLRKLHKVN
jgi:uncharacterized membrane protein YbhN (UPF0104 family)